MTKNANDVVVVNCVRTPFDAFGGVLANVHSSDITVLVLQELLKRSGLKAEQFDEVNHGSALCAEMALKGDIPIRQAIIAAGFPLTTLSNTIDRACCSSTSALQVTWRNLKLGESTLAITTGADNMANIPLIMDSKFRHNGSRLGDIVLVDKLIELGYKGFGIVAKDAGEVAIEHGVTREMQDEWAAGSHAKWGKAFERGFFNDEYFKVEIEQGKNKPPRVLEKDMSPRPSTTVEGLAKLPCVYGSPTVTAGNAPGLNAGASGMIVTTRKKAEELGLKPLARILQVVSVADHYKLIASVPAAAISKGLEMTGIKLDDVDLIEINEAFAAMPLVSTKVLSNGDEGKWKHLKDITNVNGGSVAIGHPIGATGVRITLTMIRELLARNARYGVSSICGGLAQGDAVVIEAEYN